MQTGILYTNDVDYQLARLLATEVITEEPFYRITREHLQKALQVMEKCKKVNLCRCAYRRMQQRTGGTDPGRKKES